MRRPFAAAALAVVVGGRPAGGQVVQGRVVLAGSAKPVEGVPVRLVRVTPADTAPLPADTTPLAVYRTGRDGFFTLAAPDTGAYRARIGDGFVGPVMHLASADTLAAHEYRVQLGEARALDDFEVQRQASLVGGLTTRYPKELQAQCVTGSVVAQFVVDTAGRAELRTFRAVRSTDARFTMATRDAVGAARFVPAQVAGRPVRQRVQLPVTFLLEGAGVCVPQAGPRSLRPLPSPFSP